MGARRFRARGLKGVQSALYLGWIRHRRFVPRPHRFRYPLFLSYLDLSELPGLYDGRWLWSARRPALAWFRRADYLGDPAVPLDTAVRDCIAAAMGTRPSGPIRLLTHLRFLGWRSNPVSFYYCFAPDGERLETIVAEITNTPWDERHAYVLPVDAAERVGVQVLRFGFDKAFHVSPFLPMDMQYDWRFTAPGRTLGVHMTNLRGGVTAFDATLQLRRSPLTAANLARMLIRFPWVTARVSAAIYWQAARLWLRGMPFFPHPRTIRYALRTGREREV